MHDSNLGKALVGLEQSRAADPQQIARRVIRRDTIRIRILTGLATLCWTVAAAGILWLICFYFMYVVPRLDAYAAHRLELQNDWSDWIRAFNAGARILLGCIASLLLAAVSTVLLILSSRRATLHQINVELAGISDQLKQLRLQQPVRQSAE